MMKWAAILVLSLVAGDGSLADVPLATWRGDLLDRAFKSVSSMPVNPHLKNRSRAQEAVVTACLELDLPARALRYVDQIGDWRRGKGYADVAFWAAQHQETADVPRLLELALQIAEREAKDEDAQDWQRDRIKVTIAKTHVWLGHAAEAARLQANTEVFESGKVEAVKAMVIDADAFEAEFKSLGDVLASGSFDPMQSALETCAQLFNRFYGDAEKRARLEEKIKGAWSKLPTQIRVDLSLELATFALHHDDRAKALALAQETRALIDGSKWEPNDHLPMVARLAELRFRAGDAKAARAELDAALARYDAERDRIVDIYRAGTLRPLAEAYQAMGDGAAAVAVYKRCVEEGIANPNSRPRADDLAATCCSMALHGVEPDAALWSRLIQVEGKLGDPW
jgi:tetratricopeptide (TPR) repeat protein